MIFANAVQAQATAADFDERLNIRHVYLGRLDNPNASFQGRPWQALAAGPRTPAYF